MAVASLLLRAHASESEGGKASHVSKQVARELETFARGHHDGTVQDLFRNLRQLFRRLRDEAGPGGPVDSTGPDGGPRTLTYTVSRQQHPDGGVFAAAVTVVIKGVVCHEEPFDFDEATAESVSFVVSPPATSADRHGVARSAEGFTVSIGCAKLRDTCFPLSLLSTDDQQQEVPQVNVARADANTVGLAESGLALAYPAYRFLHELLAPPPPPPTDRGAPVADSTLRIEETARLTRQVVGLETRIAGLEDAVRAQNDNCRKRFDDVVQTQRAAERDWQAHTNERDKALHAAFAKSTRDHNALETKLRKCVESATETQKRADDSHTKTLRDTYRKIWRATDGRLREVTTFNGACWALKHHSATISPIVVGRRMYIIARGVHGIVGPWMSLDDNAQGNVPTISSMPAVGEDWNKPEFFRAWQATSVADRYIVVAARQANAMHFRVLDTKGKEAWNEFGHVDPLTKVEWSKSAHHETVQIAAVGASWLVAVARRGTGLVLWVASTNTLADPSRSPVWKACPILTGLSDAAGFEDPKYYRTIKLASGHDGKSLFCVARGPDTSGATKSEGLQAWRIDCETRKCHALSSLPGAFATSSGWDKPEYYETAQLVALSSTSFVFLMRGSDGISGYRLDVPLKGTATWTPIQTFAGFSDSGAWNNPEYYRTLRLVCRSQCDDAVLVGRTAIGAVAYTFDDTKRQPWRSMQMPSDNSCFGNDAGFIHETAYETCRVVVDSADVFMCGRGAKGYYVQRLTAV